MKEATGGFLCPTCGNPMTVKRSRFDWESLQCSVCGHSYPDKPEILPVCPLCFSSPFLIQKNHQDILICSNPDCQSHKWTQTHIQSAITSYDLYATINGEEPLFSLEIMWDIGIRDYWHISGQRLIGLILNLAKEHFKQPDEYLKEAMIRFPQVNTLINFN